MMTPHSAVATGPAIETAELHARADAALQSPYVGLTHYVEERADVFFGRGQTILIERERIKRQTIANRRLLHRRQAA